MKLDIYPILLIGIAVLLPCGVFLQFWLFFPNISFHTQYWWVQEKTSSCWLYRFLGCSIFSRVPQVSHLGSILPSLGARQLSMFFLSHPTCSCPLASSSSFGILSSLKSLPVSANKFRLFRQFARHLLGLLQDKSPRSPM